MNYIFQEFGSYFCKQQECEKENGTDNEIAEIIMTEKFADKQGNGCNQINQAGDKKDCDDDKCRDHGEFLGNFDFDEFHPGFDNCQKIFVARCYCTIDQFGDAFSWLFSLFVGPVLFSGHKVR